MFLLLLYLFIQLKILFCLYKYRQIKQTSKEILLPEFVIKVRKSKRTKQFFVGSGFAIYLPLDSEPDPFSKSLRDWNSGALCWMPEKAWKHKGVQINKCSNNFTDLQYCVNGIGK